MTSFSVFILILQEKWGNFLPKECENANKKLSKVRITSKCMNWHADDSMMTYVGVSVAVYYHPDVICPSTITKTVAILYCTVRYWFCYEVILNILLVWYYLACKAEEIWVPNIQMKIKSTSERGTRSWTVIFTDAVQASVGVIITKPDMDGWE